MTARVCFALEIDREMRVGRDERVPRQCALKELGAGDSAGEPSRHNDRSKQTASAGSDAGDDRHSESQSGNAHRTQDVVVVFNNGARHYAPAKIPRIVHRLPPSRIYQSQVADAEEHSAHDTRISNLLRIV